MKLRLTNKTRYRSADLRRILLACCNAFEITGARYVEVTYHRNTGHTGWAYYATRQTWSQIKLYIPPLAKLQMNEFLWLVEHEVLHTINVKHEDMTRAQLRCPKEGLPPRWARDVLLPMHEEAPKPQPSPEDRARLVVAKRQLHAMEMLLQHERAEKREHKLVAKWRAKVRYYARTTELKAAAKTQSSEGSDESS
jgi:hypothetical protein